MTRHTGTARSQAGSESGAVEDVRPSVADPVAHGPAPRLAHVAAVIVAALVWSTSYAVAKRILADVGPLTSGSWRFLLAAVVLAVVVRTRGGWTRPSDRQLVFLAVSGLLGITLFFALENIGLGLATASDAALIVAAQPLMAMCIEFLVLRMRLSPVRVGGVILAMTGVVLIVRNGAQAGGTHRYIGDVLMLLNSIVWAAYTFLSRMSGKGCSTVVSTYYQTLAGAAGFLVTAVIAEPQEWRVPSLSISALVAYLAVFCSVAAFLLYNYGLTGMASSTAVSLLNLVPVFGLVSAVAIAGEPIEGRQVAGGVVVILGVTLGTRDFGAQKNRPEGPQPQKPAAPTSQPRKDEPVPEERRSHEKVAVVIDRDLPPGLAMNAASVLALSIGRFTEGVVGPDVKDGSGAIHRGVTMIPVPILTAAAGQVRDIVLRAQERTDVVAVDFTSIAQSSRTYDEYVDRTAPTPTEDLPYVGVALAGPRKAVDKLTGSLPLFK